MEGVPRLVILLCGKRKSGKDYIAAKLKELLSDRVCLIRLSQPLKVQYALEHGLDADRLMDASPYKEIHRRDMIRWGEERRNLDPGYFCRLAIAEADKPVWLVCDARRPTDMEYFKARYSCLTVRVVASEGVRVSRGWVETKGIDDAPSECALDGYPCDITMTNNDGGGEAELLKLLKQRTVDAMT